MTAYKNQMGYLPGGGREGKTKTSTCKKSAWGLGLAALSPYKEIHIHGDSGQGGTGVGWGGVGVWRRSWLLEPRKQILHTGNQASQRSQ